MVLRYLVISLVGLQQARAPPRLVGPSLVRHRHARCFSRVGKVVGCVGANQQTMQRLFKLKKLAMTKYASSMRSSKWTVPAGHGTECAGARWNAWGCEKLEWQYVGVEVLPEGL